MKYLCAALLLCLSAQVKGLPFPVANMSIHEISVQPRYETPVITDRGANWVETKPHELPFIARIDTVYEKGSDGTDAMYTCGGSLINRRHVLTAANCFLDQLETSGKLQPELVDVSLDDHSAFDIQGDDITYHAAEIIMHPNFDKESFENNVAIIRLPEDAPSRIPSVCLKKSTAADGTPVTVAGWGQDKYKGKHVDKLRKSANIKVMSHDKCLTRYPTLPKYQSLFCTYNEGPNGDEEPCFGDQGDPMFYEEGGKIVQAGMFSHGWVCGMSAVPAEYTDTSGFVSFVQKTASSGGDVCVVD